MARAEPRFIFRSSLMPIATACFRLVTFGPDLEPERREPRPYSRIVAGIPGIAYTIPPAEPSICCNRAIGSSPP